MHVSTFEYTSFKQKLWIKKSNSETQNKFNNSVKEPEEAGLFGSGPRENQFIC